MEHKERDMIPEPWSRVTIALFNKYPNPFSSHVLSSDVLERSIDPTTGALVTTRLLLKKGVMPQWARHLFKIQEAYILEKSTCYPAEERMLVETTNLSHRWVMLVQEVQEYTSAGHSQTHTQLYVNITSSYGWQMLRSKIESFAIMRYKNNARNSLKGLVWRIQQMRTPSSAFHSLQLDRV